jgi:Rrf2 family protein
MKISTRTRYGLRAMIDLALNYKDTPIFVKDIAKRQNVSYQYLEHIMLALKKAGLVSSLSGAKGGYMLKKKPADITAYDIVTVLESSLSPVPCLDTDESCNQHYECKAGYLWKRIKKSIEEILLSTTLKDMAENNEKEKKREIFYHI